MLELLLAIIIGCLLGTITGIAPGIHINLVSAIVLSLSSILLSIFQPLFLALTLVSMGITHTFLDIIPSTLLGLPNEDNVLKALPAHRLTLIGESKKAVFISSFGAFIGLITIILLSPMLLEYLKIVYVYINPFIVYILILVSLFMIYRSKNKLKSLFVFSIAGVLGIIVLNSKFIVQPLLPLLSGLFGVSALFLSINKKTLIPKQKDSFELKTKDLSVLKNTTSASVSAILTSFLPGLTSSHTSLLSSMISKTESELEYLFINGAIGTISMFTSLIAWFSIDKARNGIIVTLSNIASLNKASLWIIISSTLISSCIALFLVFYFSKKVISLVEKIDYKKLCWGIILFITILTLFISGILGIIVLITACSIGVLPELLDVEKSHLMGVLLVSVILFLL